MCGEYQLIDLPADDEHGLSYTFALTGFCYVLVIGNVAFPAGDACPSVANGAKVRSNSLHRISSPTPVMKTKNPLLLSQALAQVHRPADLWRHREFRFLLIGAINTLFGYSLGVGLYLALVPRLHILFIGLTCNVLAITFSFTTYKLLVFRTRGNWLAEYLKSYVVYGASAVFAILFLWFLVDGLSMPIWIAQGLAILFTAVVSFLAHARFTFRRTLHHSTDV